MSFHSSSTDIHIVQENGSTLLRCQSRDNSGNMIPHTIRLDDHIGNTDGWFIWGGTNFTQSSQNIVLDQTNRGPKLTAELHRIDGSFRERQGIFLADKIANENGRLRFLGP